MSTLKTNIAVSASDDLIEGVKEAGEEVKARVGKPKLLMFLCTYTHSADKYSEALEFLQGMFPGSPIIGGSVFGFVTKDKFYNDKGVVILSLESDHLEVGVGIGQEVDKNAKEAGKTSILQALDNLDYNPSIAYLAMMRRGVRDISSIRPINGFLLTPGPGPNHPQIGDRILRGISEVAKRMIRMVGGGTMGGLPPGWPEDFELKDFPLAYQFFNGKVYTESVVSVVFGSDLEIGYGCVNGYRPVGPGAFVTEGKGWVISEVNGMSAGKALGELIEEYTEIKKEDFLENAAHSLYSYGYSFGQPEATGDFHWLHSPMKVINNEEILNFTEVRKGSAFALLRTDEKTVKKDNEELVRMIIEDAGTDEMGLVLFFTSYGRHWNLKDAYLEEERAIKRTVGEKTPVLGIVTGGTHGFYKHGPLMDATNTFSAIGISNKLISETFL